ncbi:putative ribonuclease H-like domain-containing protein, partial [Tanacetum coccineum]
MLLNTSILRIAVYKYAVSIKEDTGYLCLDSPKTTKDTRPIRRIQEHSNTRSRYRLAKIYSVLGLTMGIRACEETLSKKETKTPFSYNNPNLTKLNMSGSQDDIPPPPPPPSQTQTKQTPYTISTIKLPILKKGEYDIWAMKMEHYLAYTDYPIWEVIQNGNGPVSITTDTQGQIKLDEFDLEEMDLKWQVDMISMRMKKFYKKTGRKLQFDAKEPVGTKGNQDGRRRDAWNSGNKDGRRSGKQEDSKALVTIDGEGVDWTSHLEEEEDYALMACNSSGSDTKVISCSKECKESYVKLKKLYNEQRAKLSDASIEIKAYTQALKNVEAKLVAPINKSNFVSVVGVKGKTAIKPSAGCNWRPKRHYWHKISKYNGGSRPRDCATFKDPLGRLKPKQAWDANDAAEALRKEFTQETEDLLLQAGAAKASSNYNIISKHLEDESLVDASRKNCYNFKIQKVWILVDLPYGKKAIGTKWVYRNKKDGRGVVVRNKARLVSQGHRQEEGIDYDEVFAPVARIEAIRIFLAFVSYMGFIVYQIDVKSVFLYRKIDEEVYVSQPPGFIDPKSPKKNGYRRRTIDKTLFIKKDKNDIMLVQVYVDDIIFGSTKKSWCDEFEALMKSRFQMSSMGKLTFFLGLQVKQKEDGIFISQDKYVAEILKKFDFLSVKTASTPIETQKPLVRDEEASDVDVHLYRSMMGSLMYLTASRPDIMFVVCTCSRFQVTPKTSHLSAVKRIF